MFEWFECLNGLNVWMIWMFEWFECLNGLDVWMVWMFEWFGCLNGLNVWMIECFGKKAATVNSIIKFLNSFKIINN
jgi:hypothetical protein